MSDLSNFLNSPVHVLEALIQSGHLEVGLGLNTIVEKVHEGLRCGHLLLLKARKLAGPGGSVGQSALSRVRQAILSKIIFCFENSFFWS